MRRKGAAIILMCALIAIAGFCLIEAYIIWEGMGNGDGSNSFDEFDRSFEPYDNRGTAPDDEPMVWDPYTNTVPRNLPKHAPFGTNPVQGQTKVMGPVVEIRPIEVPEEPEIEKTKEPEVAEGPFEEPEEPEVEEPEEDNPDIVLPPVEERPFPDDELLIPKLLPLIELETLAELEGEQNFSRSTRPWYYPGQGQGQGQGSGDGGTAPGGIGSGYENDGIPDDATNPTDREVEESDIISLQGDILYVLNAYRGLIIIDLSVPDAPEMLATFSVMGNPVNMYVVDDFVYMVVARDFRFWYMYAYYESTGALDASAGNPGYQIGSKLVIVNVHDPSDPQLLLDMPIEGIISDSRRVGEVLYYVSSCSSWYNDYSEVHMDDVTKIVSLNIVDPVGVFMVDETLFGGNSYVVHVSTDYMFVSQWSQLGSGATWRNGYTDITVVDISDPMGSICLMDHFSFVGKVWDKYQMDQFGDTFRVVTLTESPPGSRLLTYDISSPDDVKTLGYLLIDDAGELMATRFAGDRAYTIHLPVPTMIDPLEVIDLSNPSSPVLCDVFEMPGWVTHLEVRGMKILAIGVDDSNRQRNVAVSLFDVSNPWNAIMQDRVRIGGYRAVSEAITEPKALTVLDDQNLILVPFGSKNRGSDGSWEYYSGVQLVSYDFDKGNLELRGEYSQDSTVLRTRGLGDHVVSTSNDQLVVADISDLDEPKITATVAFCSDVIDFHAVNGRFVEIVSESRFDSPYGYSNNRILRVFSEGASDLSPPLWELELELDYYSGTRFWDGRFIHVVTEEAISYPFDLLATSGYRRFITISTYDLLGNGPEPYSEKVIDVGDWYRSSPSAYYQYQHNCQGQGRGQGAGSIFGNYDYYLGSELGNPVMLKGGYMAIYTTGNLWLVGVGRYTSFLPVTNIKAECDNFIGLLPYGRNLFLVSGEYQYITIEDMYRQIAIYEVTPVRFQSWSYSFVGDSIVIPGIPLRSSDDGKRLYTICSWYMEENDWTTALNVVSISDGQATVVWAVSLEARNAWIDGDNAFITEYSYENFYSDAGKVLKTTYQTNVFIVDLLSAAVTWATVTEGSIQISYAGNGVVMFSNYYSDSMFILDYEDPTDITECWVPTVAFFRSVDRDGGMLYLTMGKYGVVTIDLDR
jgi:hypothetical protein